MLHLADTQWRSQKFSTGVRNYKMSKISEF